MGKFKAEPRFFAKTENIQKQNVLQNHKILQHIILDINL